MKAFLIDPHLKVITSVDCAPGIDPIYALLEARPFDVCYIDQDDVLYVDDEGLLKPNEFFTLNGRPFAGKAVVLGDDREGNTIDAHHTLDELSARVAFVTREGALQAAKDGGY